MKKKLGLILGVVLVSSSIMAFAGGTYSNYNTTVGKLNGSGYTGYQIKSINGAAANLNSEVVGGNYTVDVRMQDSNGSVGDWSRDVNDNDSRLVDGSSQQIAGDSVRLQFSNDLTTAVDVQVSGTWKSN